MDVSNQHDYLSVFSKAMTTLATKRPNAIFGDYSCRENRL